MTQVLKSYYDNATVRLGYVQIWGSEDVAACEALVKGAPATNAESPAAQASPEKASEGSDTTDQSRLGKAITKRLQKKITQDQSSQWAAPVADVDGLKSKVELGDMVGRLLECTTPVELADLTASLIRAMAMLKQLRESAKKGGHRN